MRKEARSGNGRTLSRASATVKQNPQETSRSLRASQQAPPPPALALPPPKNAARVPRSPVPPPPLPAGLQPPATTPKLDLFPRTTLGAIILGELLDNSQAMMFCEAASYLEGVRQLIEDHRDLHQYAAALLTVCAGERKLNELRADLDDELLHEAAEAWLDRALPLFNARLRQLASTEPTAHQYLDVLDDIKQGLAVLDGLRAQLAAL